MKKVVTRDPEILGGEPVFAGTRVPIKSLFDHLEAADSIADFLEDFPSVGSRNDFDANGSDRIDQNLIKVFIVEQQGIT